MRIPNVVWGCIVAVGLAACGGAQGGGDETLEPAACPECSEGNDSSGDTGTVLIPEQKFVEIQKVFDRKTQTVSRCYVEGFEAGEVKRTDKGYVTVGLTINMDGSAANVRVLDTSFQSEALSRCVVDMVSGWIFTTLPKTLETSHTYVLQRL